MTVLGMGLEPEPQPWAHDDQSASPDSHRVF
jgi:hypothetical protein